MKQSLSILCTGRRLVVGLGVAVLSTSLTGACAVAHADPAQAPAVLTGAIDPTLQQKARGELIKAFASKDPLERAQAIEASVRGRDPGTSDRVLKGLTDPDAMVRFAAAMAAGDAKVKSAYESLLKLVEDPNPNVQVAVRYALHRLGDRRFSHDLEVFARSPNDSVRSNTVVVLGLIGDKSAVKILNRLRGDPSSAVRLQVSEALWRLKETSGLESLIAATISGYAEDEMIGTLALAEPRDPRALPHVRGKLLGTDKDEWREVRLAAARALGMLGNDDGYKLAIDSASTGDPRQRVLAALALGEIGKLGAQPTLATLLNDRSGQVRLAAATAILQLDRPSETASMQ